MSKVLIALALLALLAARVRAYDINVTHGRYVHWETDTVTLQLAPELGERFGELEARGAADAAAAAWAGIPGVPTIVIEDWAAGGENGNTVHLVPPTEWMDEATQLAHTNIVFLKYTGVIVYADVYINAVHPFAVEPTREQFDLQSMLTHEFGHVLGLGETDHDHADTMWPKSVPGETHKRTITEWDARNVQHLYEVANAYRFSSWDAMGCQITRVREGGPPGAVLFFLLVSVFVYWFRRRGH